MLSKLIDHMQWANSTVISWLGETPAAPEECLRLMSHILNAERIWLARFLREEYDRDVFKVHALEDMPALHEANQAGFRSLLGMDLQAPLDYQLLNGSPGRSSIEDMILHVFSHGFHHVGQMSALASKAGRKFPNVSYIGFTRSR